MTPNGVKEEAIKAFIDAWDRSTMLGLEVCDDEDRHYIDKDDIDIREADKE